MEKIIRNKERILLILILLLAAFLRIYRISEYQTFLGDEGRDALIAKEILEGNFTLLGPRASAGDFFLGPIYYYLMAPALFLSGYDPVGPAVLVALLGVLTVYILYRFGSEWFGKTAGLIASGLYSVSHLVISYSRSSWNPNPLPFFSLLILYLLFKGVKSPSWKLFLIIGILFGITMQLHYIAVFLGVIMTSFILLGNVLLHQKRVHEGSDRKTYSLTHLRSVGKVVLTQYAQIVIGFLLGISPFLLFEVRHGFPNIRTILTFIFVNNAQAGRQDGVLNFFGTIGDVFFRVFGRLLFHYPIPQLENQYTQEILLFWTLVILLFSLFSLLILFKNKNKLTVLLFSLWLLLGIGLFGFYKKSIYDYYFGFLFPLPFLLVGNALGEGLQVIIKKKMVRLIGLSLALAIFIFNLINWPFSYTPNRQKQKAKEVADFVLSKAGNKPFNFALVTKGNSDHAFRYFLHIKDRDPITINNTIDDPQRKSVTDQLFVVCDFKDCSPLGHPLFDVAGFGRAEVDGKWELEEVVIFKLVHFTGEVDE